jgi:hypothetical protein
MALASQKWLLLICGLQVTRDLRVNQEVTVSVHFGAAAALLLLFIQDPQTTLLYQ